VQLIRRIFANGVDYVKAKLSSHVKLSYSSLEIILQLLSAQITKRDVDEAMRKIAALEREGDKVIRDLLDEVTQGTVVPTVTNLVILLLENMDDVLDLFYFTIKEIKRGFHLWQNKNVYATALEIKEIFDLVKLMLDYFQRMLYISNNEDIKNCARIIDSLEEKIDEIKENMLNRIYSLELTAVEFNHLVALVYTADKIADNIQDAAYHLLTVEFSA